METQAGASTAPLSRSHWAGPGRHTLQAQENVWRSSHWTFSCVLCVSADTLTSKREATLSCHLTTSCVFLGVQFTLPSN